MKRKLTSVSSFAVYIFAFLGFQALGSEVTGKDSNGLCAAKPTDAVYSSSVSIDATLSEACFVPFERLTGKYSYVNVSAESRLRILPDSALSLPIHQVKSKQFLKTERLLIAAEPFKRFELAKLCRELIQRGFQNPNIVIWSPVEFQGRGSLDVPAQDFLVEVLNFGAVVIASDKSVADQLRSLDISAFYPGEQENLKTLLQKIAPKYSANGYLPTFYVRSSTAENAYANTAFPVYTVIGGLKAVRSAFDLSVLNALKQRSDKFRGSCAG